MLNQNQIQMTEISPVWTKIDRPDLIKDYLKCPKVFYKQGQFRKEKKSYYLSLVRNGYFYSGFKSRVAKYLSDHGYVCSIDKPTYEMKPQFPPIIEGITLRDDQITAVDAIVKAERGVWKAPTGGGKTVLCGAVISMFPDMGALIIVHKKGLLQQTRDELQKFFPNEKIGTIGDGIYNPQGITVAMIQTLAKKIKRRTGFEDSFGEQFGVVIIDEVHHCSTFGGIYERVLSNILAPIRVGFTATMPEDEEGKLAMEGLVGTLTGFTPYEELQEKGVLAKPKMKLLWVPETDRYKYLKGGYTVVYEEGIVKNRIRNDMLVKEAKSLIDKGLTVLIMVERVEHGQELLKFCETVMPGIFVFLHGETPTEITEDTKARFERQEQKGVIVTRIWSEGINIKTVGAVINAVGGISEIATLQRFGRGLRSTKDKKEVILVDTIDVNHIWFQKHSLKRLYLYFEQGWIS